MYARNQMRNFHCKKLVKTSFKRFRCIIKNRSLDETNVYLRWCQAIMYSYVRYRKLLHLIVVYRISSIRALIPVLCQVISLEKGKNLECCGCLFG